MEEIKQRQHRLRLDRPPLSLHNYDNIVVVDDGIATGATMMAALECLRNELEREKQTESQVAAGGKKRIIVAVPCAAPDTLKRVRRIADDVICLTAPHGFHAVGYDAVIRASCRFNSKH